MKTKEIECRDCGKKTMAKRIGCLCMDCKIENYIKSNKEQMKEKQKIRFRVRKQCVVCETPIPSRYKCCPLCSVAKREEYSRARKQMWNNLSSEEKTKRMDLISKKIFEENNLEENNLEEISLRMSKRQERFGLP